MHDSVVIDVICAAFKLEIANKFILEKIAL